jgi:hypothetical protein
VPVDRGGNRQAVRDIDANALAFTAGVYDTNEVERGYLRLYMYGPDANRLADVVAPALRDAPPGSYLVKRYGPDGADLERVDL